MLGYVDQLSQLSKKDLLHEAIQMALERGLNVFSFLAVDPETYADLYDLARSKGLHLEFPDFDFADVQRCLSAQGSERAVDVPVVGVFGTSSQQGKFTLQLALRQKLIEQGYNVGQLGTEHHSALFGMDFSFPMGYAAPREVPLQYYGPYLDHKMREGEIKDHLERLEASFGLPVVAIVSEEGQQRMVDVVVNHFAVERGPVSEELKKAG